MKRLMQKTMLAALLAVNVINFVHNTHADGDELGRPENQAMLAEKAKNGRSKQVREEAVRKLNVDEYKALLEEIAEDNNEDLDVRSAAVEKLHPGMEYSIRLIGDLDEKPRPRVRIVASPKTPPGLFQSTMSRECTISHFLRFSEWVVVGTVKEAAMRNNITSPPPLSSIVLSVDACIYGQNLPKGNLTLPILIRNENETNFDEMDRRVPKPGDRMLMFLCDRGNGLIGPGLFHRAHIFLDNKETEEAVINVVKKYTGTFKDGGKKNQDAYYEFICSLLNSPVKRIRDDAERDLVLFYMREPSLDVNKPLADGRIREEIKDYLRYLLRDEKPKEEKP